MRTSRGWDRVALASSWVAPGAAAVGAALIILMFFADEQGPVFFGESIFVVIFVAIAACGALAHLLLCYHVYRWSPFSSDEASSLGSRLILGLGYSEWRALMRRAGRL